MAGNISAIFAAKDKQAPDKAVFAAVLLHSNREKDHDLGGGVAGNIQRKDLRIESRFSGQRIKLCRESFSAANRVQVIQQLRCKLYCEGIFATRQSCVVYLDFWCRLSRTTQTSHRLRCRL